MSEPTMVELVDEFDDGLGDYYPYGACDQAECCGTDDIDIGTCQGCGAYGTPGRVHYRRVSGRTVAEECGEYL